MSRFYEVWARRALSFIGAKFSKWAQIGRSAEKAFGHIDEVNPLFIRGWAASAGATTKITITIPNMPRMTVYPDQDRPDVESRGFPVRSGFRLRLRRPLSTGTRIAVMVNQKRLPNSPWRFMSPRSRE
jgi:hypothetical protein